MLSEGELSKARAYNRRRAGTLWMPAQLIWPLTEPKPNSTCFAQMVALYQAEHGLVVDGQLGPATYSTMRVTAVEPTPDSDDEGESRDREPARPAPPPRDDASNRLYIGGRKVALPKRLLDAGIRVTNHVDDGEHAFEFWPRDRKITHLVLHETVTRSVPATVRVLEAKRARSIREGKKGGKGYPYGVHLIGAPDGHISQHADLLTASLTHAGHLNRYSIGWEIVNPYTARKLAAPFDRTIAAKWWTWVPKGAPRKYTLPTEAQIEMVELFVPWLVEQLPHVPFAFPTKGLNARKRKVSGWREGKRTKPGIVAHGDVSSHADGRYFLEHLMQAGANP